MQRASDFLGMPVALTGGARVGQIRDLLLDLPRRRVVALALERPDTLLAPVNHSIEDDTILLDREEQLAKGQVAKRMARGTTSYLHLRNLAVVNPKGRTVGQVEDVILHGATLLGLEIGDGLLHDLVNGRGYIPLVAEILIAQGKIVVEDQEEDYPVPWPWSNSQDNARYPM
jgi:uncharacterized protein YrrD